MQVREKNGISQRATGDKMQKPTLAICLLLAAMSLPTGEAHAVLLNEANRIVADSNRTNETVLIAGRRSFGSSRSFRRSSFRSSRSKSSSFRRGSKSDRDGDGISCERGCRSGGRIGGNTFSRYRRTYTSSNSSTDLPGSSYRSRRYGERADLGGRKVFWNGLIWLPVSTSGGFIESNPLYQEEKPTITIPLGATKALVEEFMSSSGYPDGRPDYIPAFVVPLCAGGKKAVTNMNWYSSSQYRQKKMTDSEVCRYRNWRPN